MAKKPWKKTELIVFVRGKPEENVLTACKLPRGRPFIGLQQCVPAHGNPLHNIGKS